MKIKYVFANGEVKWVDVSEDVASVIEESRRVEENADRKYRYHNYSLNTSDYEGEEYLDDNTPETVLIGEEERKEMDEFIIILTPTQRKRLLMKLNGKSMNEIARLEKTTFRAVKKSFLQISEKFFNFFQK